METTTPTPPQIQTSFIPKQTMVKQPASPRRLPAGLATIVAFLILGLSIAAFAFAFAYRAALLSEINAKCPDASADTNRGCGLIATLERERERLDPQLLTEFRRVNAKMKLAETVLAKHATLVPLFTFLNENTLQTVQYQRFSFSPTGVIIEGTAEGYEDIALQSREFGKHKDKIQGFIFSDLNLDQNTGNVVFKLEMTVNPSVLSYRDYWLNRQTGFEQLPSENQAPAASGSNEQATTTTQ
ncbi:MAG TPA: hypothetical protein VEB60_01030 [Candidatus Paceibacterota bacterium]|nr:hypothetical protein [Candidatus Paceibacterota bacterium]